MNYRCSPPQMSQTVPGGVQSIHSLQFGMEEDAVTATNGKHELKLF